MIRVGALLLAYLLLVFVGSAIVVRLWPRSRVAKRLRLDLAAFPFVPALLLIAGAQVAGRGLNAGLAWLFIRLSGQRRYRRYRSYYAHGKRR